jgi:hypothetical protein
LVPAERSEAGLGASEGIANVGEPAIEDVRQRLIRTQISDTLN